MQNKWLWLFVPGLLLATSGCPDIDVDENEVGTGGPIVEFDPGNRIIPFPNNLLLDPATGKVNLPEQCNESPTSKAIREGVLNTLDGFGTFEIGLQVTFSEPVDPATLADRVVLYKRASGTMPVDPAAATLVPVTTRIGETTRFTADCASSAQIASVAIIPLVPLDQKSIYTVGLLSGIQTATGEPYTAAFTWSLVRQAENPVTVDDTGTVIADRTPLDATDPEDRATLLGLDLLWKAHAQALGFLEAKGHARSDLLLAWEFKTQTVTDPLDPSVAGSLAANVPAAPLLGIQSLTANINRTAPPYVLCDPAGGGPGTDNNTQCYLKIALGVASGGAGATIYPTGDAVCAQVGCANVGDVVGGALSAAQYQLATPNAFDPGATIPGPWADPIAPAAVGDELIEVLAFVPAVAPPATGYPTIVFGHGLGSSKTALFAFGPQLATPRAPLGFTTGFMSVAIDFVAHGSRAVQTTDDAALACAGTPDPTAAPQCFAPFLSPNLAGTRDNIRQSVLDVHGLIEALEACGTTACDTNVPTFQVDPAHIAYAGQSLGGIIGSIVVATKDELQGSLINVGGVGWLDILENTESLAIRCSLVNGLIAADVLMGEPWNPQAGTGLCTTDAWKAQPGYRTFASIGRWILDPADPANFTRKLAGQRFLLQEVVGDQVIPNLATDNAALLTGLTAMNADPAASPTPAPSAAITTDPLTSKFVKYPTLPADAGSGFPGNTFGHASLLRPANGMLDGQLGTIRMQTDAITYLVINR